MSGPSQGKKVRIPRNVMALARKASSAPGAPMQKWPAPSPAGSVRREKIVSALKKLHPMD